MTSKENRAAMIRRNAGDTHHPATPPKPRPSATQARADMIARNSGQSRPTGTAADARARYIARASGRPAPQNLRQDERVYREDGEA